MVSLTFGLLIILSVYIYLKNKNFKLINTCLLMVCNILVVQSNIFQGINDLILTFLILVVLFTIDLNTKII